MIIQGQYFFKRHKHPPLYLFPSIQNNVNKLLSLSCMGVNQVQCLKCYLGVAQVHLKSIQTESKSI